MKVKKYELEEVIEKLQMLVEDMEANELEEVETSCNTYGLYEFISFGSKGYLNLDPNALCELTNKEDEDYE